MQLSSTNSAIRRICTGVMRRLSSTLLLVVIVAKLVGCLLPLLVKAAHLDPAVVANPFITTVVDALALVVYFALAAQWIPALAGF